MMLNTHAVCRLPKCRPVACFLMEMNYKGGGRVGKLIEGGEKQPHKSTGREAVREGSERHDYPPKNVRGQDEESGQNAFFGTRQRHLRSQLQTSVCMHYGDAGCT